MSLELPTEPNPGDLVTAHDFALLIRAIRRLEQRVPGPRPTRRGPAADDRPITDLPISFWPRLVVTPIEGGGAQSKLHIRGGYVSAEGGAIEVLTPAEGDEFIFDPGPIYLCYRSANLRNPEISRAWSIEAPGIGQAPSIPWNGGFAVRVCDVARQAPGEFRINQSWPGDKIGLNAGWADYIGDSAGGTFGDTFGNAIIQFDFEQGRFDAVPWGMWPGDEPEHTKNWDGRLTSYETEHGRRYKWKPDVPDGALPRDLMVWDHGEGYGRWVLLEAEHGALLYYNGVGQPSGRGWRLVPPPATPSLLQYDPMIPAPRWAPESDYKNP